MMQYATLPTGGPASSTTDTGRKPLSPGCHGQLIQIVCTDDVYQPVAACLLSISAKLTPSIFRMDVARGVWSVV